MKTIIAALVSTLGAGFPTNLNVTLTNLNDMYYYTPVYWKGQNVT